MDGVQLQSVVNSTIPVLPTTTSVGAMVGHESIDQGLETTAQWARTD